ncbi:MAG: hypothetical protein ACYC0O_13710, partial [Desulfurivibrionaceae bacterium]
CNPLFSADRSDYFFLRAQDNLEYNFYWQIAGISGIGAMQDLIRSAPVKSPGYKHRPHAFFRWGHPNHSVDRTRRKP